MHYTVSQLEKKKKIKINHHASSISKRYISLWNRVPSKHFFPSIPFKGLIKTLIKSEKSDIRGNNYQDYPSRGGQTKKGQKKFGGGKGGNRASYPRARSKRLSNGFDVALTCIFRHVGFEFQVEPEPIRSKPLRNGQPSQGRSLRQFTAIFLLRAVQRVGGNVVVLQRVYACLERIDDDPPLFAPRFG